MKKDKEYGLRPKAQIRQDGAITVKRPWHIKNSAQAIDIRVKRKWLTNIDDIMACFGRNHGETETDVALEWLKARYPKLPVSRKRPVIADPDV